MKFKLEKHNREFDNRGKEISDRNLEESLFGKLGLTNSSGEMYNRMVSVPGHIPIQTGKANEDSGGGIYVVIDGESVNLKTILTNKDQPKYAYWGEIFSQAIGVNGFNQALIKYMGNEDHDIYIKTGSRGLGTSRTLANASVKGKISQGGKYVYTFDFGDSGANTDFGQLSGVDVSSSGTVKGHSRDFSMIILDGKIFSDQKTIPPSFFTYDFTGSPELQTLKFRVYQVLHEFNAHIEKKRPVDELKTTMDKRMEADPGHTDSPNKRGEGEYAVIGDMENQLLKSVDKNVKL